MRTAAIWPAADAPNTTTQTGADGTVEVGRRGPPPQATAGCFKPARRRGTRMATHVGRDSFISGFRFYLYPLRGRVAERFKAAVLKTADGKPSVSSNLTPSATNKPASPTPATPRPP